MTAPKWYDCTVSNKDGKIALQWVIDRLKNAPTDRFCIGVETGTTGYQHYQIRVVFKKPMTLNELIMLGTEFHNWQPTHVRNFEYCEKDGNFYRSWEGPLARFGTLDLWGWQKEAVEFFDGQDERRILVIVDINGCNGKSYLSKWLVAHHKAVYVPPMQDGQDFMAFGMAKPSTGYIFDMPRSESIKQRKGMWSAVEQFKNGYLYDKRYQFRDKWIEPPKIIVFCNEMPPLEALSEDRWDIFEMKGKGENAYLWLWEGE